jgi:hypothetical protein
VSSPWVDGLEQASWLRCGCGKRGFLVRVFMLSFYIDFANEMLRKELSIIPMGQHDT